MLSSQWSEYRQRRYSILNPTAYNLPSYMYPSLFGTVARDHFSESTLGVPVPHHFKGDVEALPDAILWKTLFHTKHFQISVVPDVEGVSLCGALKSLSLLSFFPRRDSNFFSIFGMADIVAVAAGFVDGLGWGSNTKGSSYTPTSTLSVAVSEGLDFSSCYNAHWNGRSKGFLPRILPIDAGTYLPGRILRDRRYHHILSVKNLGYSSSTLL
jgi:hypothetical protein